MPKASHVGRNNATANGGKRIQSNVQNAAIENKVSTTKAAAESNNKVVSDDEKHAEGTKLGHYVLGKSLGKGTFGKVKMATHELTLESVAVKILEKARIKDRKDIERISREIKILKKVRHPNVIQLYEIIETNTELYLIMEYCQNGELFDYIVQHQRLHEKAAVRIFQQLVSGIEYIHKSGVCHRDLKPENLLLDFDKSLKIVDFGLSNMYEPPSGLLKTACGSPCYAAPEMISGKKYQGLTTDIWSAGVILFAMVCGFLPFEDPKTSNLYKKILAGEFKIPKFLSTDCAHFVSKILVTDPDNRYSISDMRAHPWYKQFKDKQPDGLFPGRELMPVNDHIYEQMLDEFNFDADYSVKCIEANRHNHITATYHLMEKKNLRENKAYTGGQANNTQSLERQNYASKYRATVINAVNQGGKKQNWVGGKEQNIEIEIMDQSQLTTVVPSQEKRGRSTVTGGRWGAPEGKGVLGMMHGGDETANLNEDSKSKYQAQRRYKMELQAQMDNLRPKQTSSELNQIGKVDQNNLNIYVEGPKSGLKTVSKIKKPTEEPHKKDPVNVIRVQPYLEKEKEKSKIDETKVDSSVLSPQQIQLIQNDDSTKTSPQKILNQSKQQGVYKMGNQVINTQTPGSSAAVNNKQGVPQTFMFNTIEEQQVNVAESNFVVYSGHAGSSAITNKKINSLAAGSPGLQGKLASTSTTKASSNLQYINQQHSSLIMSNKSHGVEVLMPTKFMNNASNSRGGISGQGNETYTLVTDQNDPNSTQKIMVRQDPNISVKVQHRNSNQFMQRPQAGLPIADANNKNFSLNQQLIASAPDTAGNHHIRYKLQDPSALIKTTGNYVTHGGQFGSDQQNAAMPSVQKAQVKQNYVMNGERKPMHKNMNMTQVISLNQSANGPSKNYKQNSTKNSGQGQFQKIPPVQMNITQQVSEGIQNANNFMQHETPQNVVPRLSNRGPPNLQNNPDSTRSMRGQMRTSSQPVSTQHRAGSFRQMNGDSTQKIPAGARLNSALQTQQQQQAIAEPHSQHSTILVNPHSSYNQVQMAAVIKNTYNTIAGGSHSNVDRSSPTAYMTAPPPVHNNHAQGKRSGSQQWRAAPQTTMASSQANKAGTPLGQNGTNKNQHKNFGANAKESLSGSGGIITLSQAPNSKNPDLNANDYNFSNVNNFQRIVGTSGHGNRSLNQSAQEMQSHNHQPLFFPKKNSMQQTRNGNNEKINKHGNFNRVSANIKGSSMQNVNTLSIQPHDVQPKHSSVINMRIASNQIGNPDKDGVEMIAWADRNTPNMAGRVVQSSVMTNSAAIPESKFSHHSRKKLKQAIETGIFTAVNNNSTQVQHGLHAKQGPQVSQSTKAQNRFSNNSAMERFYGSDDKTPSIVHHSVTNDSRNKHLQQAHQRAFSVLDNPHSSNMVGGLMPPKKQNFNVQGNMTQNLMIMDNYTGGASIPQQQSNKSQSTGKQNQAFLSSKYQSQPGSTQNQFNGNLPNNLSVRTRTGQNAVRHSNNGQIDQLNINVQNKKISPKNQNAIAQVKGPKSRGNDNSRLLAQTLYSRKLKQQFAAQQNHK